MKKLLYRNKLQRKIDLERHLDYLRSPSCPLDGVDKAQEILRHKRAIEDIEGALNHSEMEVTGEYYGRLKFKASMCAVLFLALWAFLAIKS